MWVHFELSVYRKHLYFYMYLSFYYVSLYIKYNVNLSCNTTYIPLCKEPCSFRNVYFVMTNNEETESKILKLRLAVSILMLKFQVLNQTES